MAIIIDENTQVLVQGITGKESSFWTEKMLAAGTNIVAGVTPGKGGQKVHGVPVYDLVSEAVSEHEIGLSVLFVPAPFAKQAAYEALDAGVKQVVVLADGVPIRDAMEIKAVAREKEALVIGPNTAGLASIGKAMIGFIPVWLEDVYRPGDIGLLSRSGTLTNEISSHIVGAGFGISSVVGCGGDMIPCSRFVDILKLFEKDDETQGVVIVGELGGTMEEEVAEFVNAGHFSKPVVAYIAGRTAPPGKKMGHAGAIISGGRGTVKSKEEALNNAGIPVAETPSQIRELVKKKMTR